MKAEVSYSGNIERRKYGRMPCVHIDIEPENELERAILRMAYSGKRTVYIWDKGNASIHIQMPRGRNS